MEARPAEPDVAGKSTTTEGTERHWKSVLKDKVKEFRQRIKNNDDLDQLEEKLDAFALSLKATASNLGVTHGNYVFMSDLVSLDSDNSILQWVHLVMAGGGVLGVAHIGFIRMLELAGIRFLGVGGASAGAINAVLVAAGRKRPDAVSWEGQREVMMHRTDENGRVVIPFDSFEDGDKWFVRLRQKTASLGETKGILQWIWLLAKLQVFKLPFKYWQADKDLGAHPGEAFRKWMDNLLRAMPDRESATDKPHSDKLPAVSTWKDLLQRMRLIDSTTEPPHETKVFTWNGKAVDTDEDMTRQLDDQMQQREFYPLRLVATELTTQSMVILPRDADLLYALQDLDANPADFARASMSIPGFFKPFRLPYTKRDSSGNIEQVGRLLDCGVCSEAWTERNGYSGVAPEEALFCDGGMLSNFPIRLFHQDRVVEGKRAPPLLPTIGLQLGSNLYTSAKAEDCSSAHGLLLSMIDTARRSLDRAFVEENVAYRDTLAVIDVEDFNWLDFTITPKKSRRLMMLGMVAGAEFLLEWVVNAEDVAAQAASPAASPARLDKWSAYKRKREMLNFTAPADGDLSSTEPSSSEGQTLGTPTKAEAPVTPASPTI